MEKEKRNKNVARITTLVVHALFLLFFVKCTGNDGGTPGLGDWPNDGYVSAFYDDGGIIPESDHVNPNVVETDNTEEEAAADDVSGNTANDGSEIIQEDASDVNADESDSNNDNNESNDSDNNSDNDGDGDGDNTNESDGSNENDNDNTEDGGGATEGDLTENLSNGGGGDNGSADFSGLGNWSAEGKPKFSIPHNCTLHLIFKLNTSGRITMVSEDPSATNNCQYTPEQFDAIKNDLIKNIKFQPKDSSTRPQSTTSKVTINYRGQ